ncbi:hypothetical protein HDV00_012118 [Rhizophlyctis rosea]|nr:hypothetical protein HDV00_012118 [Rhizophlyctis rosea]
MAMSILGILGIVIMIPLGALINLVFVVPKPDYRNPIAKATGRVDLVYFLLRTVLVFVGYFGNTEGQLVVDLICLFIITLIHIYYQPYFNPRVNNFRVAFFTMAFLSSIVANACYFSGLSNGESWAPLGMLIACIPIGLLSGWVLTELVRRQKVRRVMDNLKLKYQLMAKDLEGGDGLTPKGSQEMRKEGGRILRSASIGGDGMGMRRLSSRKQSFVGRAIALTTGEDPKVTDEELDDIATIERYGTEVSRKAVRMPTVFHHSSEADIAMRFLRDSQVTNVGLRILHIVFKEAMEQFPKNAQLALMYSFYLSAWSNDAEMMIQYLTNAKSFKPAFDVRFKIFMEERDFEQGQHAQDLAASSLNVAAYVEVQSMERQAIESHLESLLAMKAFWTYLTQDQFDSAALPNYLDLMHRTQDNAQKFYEKLVQRYPRSKNTLRMYAKYLMVVANNTEFGQELLARADEIEAQEEREVREHAVQAVVEQRPCMPKEEKEALQAEARRPSVQFPALPEESHELPDPELSPLEEISPSQEMDSSHPSRTLGRQSDGYHEQEFSKADLEEQPSKTDFQQGVAEWVAKATRNDALKSSKLANMPTSDFHQKAKSITSSSTSRKEYRRLKARQARLKENLLVRVALV